jgi:hypothetical protein
MRTKCRQCLNFVADTRVFGVNKIRSESLDSDTFFPSS